jgi:hypothetical protein
MAPSDNNREHALLSASGASRWLACPPSARLEDTLPETSSAYADEGTLAHEVAKVQLRYFLGRLTSDEYAAAWVVFNADDRVTPDFEAAVEVYVDACIEKIDTARMLNEDAVIIVEQKLDYSHLAPEGFGTGDLVIICDGVLEVADLKFGKGILVSPVENSQLKLYALGALNEFALLYDIHTVRLTIHQPRISEEPQSWEVSVTDLLTWAETVPERAALAWAGEGEFSPGEHCRWCRAKGSCRARAELHLRAAEEDFKLPHLLGDDEIADILPKLDALINWAKSIKAHALKTACAGKRYVGWKLVRGRSTRKYANQDKVAQALIAAGVPEPLIYERSLLGITAMEKAITKKRFTEVLGGLIIKPPGALALVAHTDPRKEVEANPADDFELEEIDE